MIKTRSDPRFLVKILEKARFGATKSELLAEFPMLTSSQLRRISAELTDKEFLRLIPDDNRRYVTTDKGQLFLNKFRELGK